MGNGDLGSDLLGVREGEGGAMTLEEYAITLQEHFDISAIVEISVFAAFQNFNAKFNGALQADVNQLCPVDLPGIK